jgi:hypothetical protein
VSELVVWKCPDGHVLGQVRRTGSKVQRLLLYRRAINIKASEMSMDEVEVMAVVEGFVMDVRCSICGGMRTWRPAPVRAGWPENNPPAPAQPEATITGRRL